MTTIEHGRIDTMFSGIQLSNELNEEKNWTSKFTHQNLDFIPTNLQQITMYIIKKYKEILKICKTLDKRNKKHHLTLQ